MKKKARKKIKIDMIEPDNEQYDSDSDESIQNQDPLQQLLEDGLPVEDLEDGELLELRHQIDYELKQRAQAREQRLALLQPTDSGIEDPEFTILENWEKEEQMKEDPDKLSDEIIIHRPGKKQ